MKKELEFLKCKATLDNILGYYLVPVGETYNRYCNICAKVEYGEKLRSTWKVILIYTNP
jgi:hypothetical protein